MPQSKHRRKGQQRPRAYQTSPPPKNPPPSPSWLPVVAAILLVAGVLIILIGNLPVVTGFTGRLPLLGTTWTLVGGFAVLTVGFLMLTRWR
jgi:hypothetical protein